MRSATGEAEVVRVDELDAALRTDLAQRNLAAALCVGLAEGLTVAELRAVAIWRCSRAGATSGWAAIACSLIAIAGS